MKGSAITGPVGKEAAELWPVSYRLPKYHSLPQIFGLMLIWSFAAYCLQLRCGHVNGFQRGNWDVLERNTSGLLF